MSSRLSVSRNREEVNCVPLSVVSVKFAARLPSGSRSRTACSTAASASSVRQRCDRFDPTISRVQQSYTAEEIRRRVFLRGSDAVRFGGADRHQVFSNIAGQPVCFTLEHY